MTVRELIEELAEMPQDWIVTTDYHEIKNVSAEESFYILNKRSQSGYSIESAVILE